MIRYDTIRYDGTVHDPEVCSPTVSTVTVKTEEKEENRNLFCLNLNLFRTIYCIEQFYCMDFLRLVPLTLQ